MTDLALHIYGVSAASRNENKVRIGLAATQPDSILSNGKIQSIVDLFGATVILKEEGEETRDLALLNFTMPFKNGQWLVNPAGQVRAQDVRGKPVFRFTVSKNPSSIGAP